MAWRYWRTVWHACDALAFWRLLLLLYCLGIFQAAGGRVDSGRHFTSLSVFGDFGLLHFCWAFLSLPSLPVVSVLSFGVGVCAMSYFYFPLSF